MAHLRASLAAFAALLPLGLRAQEPRAQIETSRQFQTLPATVDLDGQRNAPEPARFDGTATEDDAFGRQVFLKRVEKPQPFSVFAEIGAFVTNNVALVKRDAQEDSFLVATTGGAFARRFAYNLRVDVSARASAYRYNKISELDFQSTDLSAGVTWTAPVLGGTDVSLRYAFTDLTTATHTREFYNNQAVLLGVQKVVPFSRAQAAYVGASAQWSFAEPQPAGRDEYSAYAGYRAQLTRHIDADLFYRYGRYIYRRGEGRKDDNHTVSISLHYTPAEWLSFSASTFFGADRSNRAAFDYDVANAGVGIQASVRF